MTFGFKKYLSFSVLVLLFFDLSSQNNYSDSLLNLYNKTKIDTIKINILYKLSKKEIYNNPEKAIKYSEKALHLSEKNNYDKGKAQSLDIFGIYHQYKGEYSEADSLYKKSLKIRKRMKNPNLITVSYNNLGVLNRLKGEYKKSEKYFIKASKICKQQNDSVFSAKIYNNIGLLYENIGKYDKALQYHMRSLKIREKINDKQSIASSLNNIGIVFISIKKYDKAFEYLKKSLNLKKEIGNKRQIISAYMNMGNVKYYQKKYDEALALYSQCLEISKLLKDKRSIAAILSNMGYIAGKKGDYEKAVSYELQSIKVLEKTENIEQLCLSYQALANFYINLKDYDKALKFAEIAKKTAIENNMLPDLKNSLDMLAKVSTLEGNYKQANLYLKEYIKIKDSLFNEKSNKQILELQAKYESEKKNRTILKLSNEKKISELKNYQFKLSVLILSFVLIGSFIFSLLWLRQNKIKQKQEKTELQEKLLRSQMNPHFIFNSISAINDYIINNNPFEASGYLSDFALLMRAILTSSSQNLITLNKEIEIVENYLKLQHLRLSDKFDYSISISDDIDTEEIEVPPMITQPFIENAVIHGIMNKKDGKGLISVSYFLKEKYLITEIEDNGVGRKETEDKTNTKHESKAEEITRRRIKLISEKYKQNISFEIIDLLKNDNTPSGTLVRFIFPI